MSESLTHPAGAVGDDAKVVEFSQQIHEHSLMAGWEYEESLQDQEKLTGYHWSWQRVLRPLMLQAYDILDPVKAERRNLCLVNPSCSGHYAAITPTLEAAVQGVCPGEIAPAHRHTAAALRFVIEGSGAFTVVNGEPLYMCPADLVLTPQWCWHDHANESEAPIVWLDVLDTPMIFGMRQWVFETYPEQIQPRAGPGSNLKRFGAGIVRPPAANGEGPSHSPLFTYPWERTEPALRALADLDEAAAMMTVEYSNPISGGPVMPTIGCYAHMLRPRRKTVPVRSNASAILHVISGTGVTTIDDVRYEWEAGDILSVPLSLWVAHENLSETEPAFLFCATDVPLLRAMGIYRSEEATDAAPA